MFSWLRRNPNAASAMKRAIILKYVFVKGLAVPPVDELASAMSQWTANEKSQFETDAARMFMRDVDHLRATGLWQDFEEQERSFLQAGIDQISPQQRIDASWLAESIVCLLWALQVVPELPPYDQEAGHEV